MPGRLALSEADPCASSQPLPRLSPLAAPPSLPRSLLDLLVTVARPTFPTSFALIAAQALTQRLAAAPPFSDMAFATAAIGAAQPSGCGQFWPGMLTSSPAPYRPASLAVAAVLPPLPPPPPPPPPPRHGLRPTRAPGPFRPAARFSRSRSPPSHLGPRPARAPCRPSLMIGRNRR
jgi:hypothetical protein